MGTIWPADSIGYWLLLAAATAALGVTAWRLRGGEGFTRRVIVTAMLLGVGVFVGLAPSVVGYVLVEEMGYDLGPGDAVWLSLAAGISLAAVGVGTWALVGDRPRGRRRCGGCWYDMSATAGLVCPECGRAARSERRLFRSRRRWRWVAAAALALVVAGGGVVAPRVRDGTWPRLVPDAALVVLLPWMMDDWAMVQELGQRGQKFGWNTGEEGSPWQSGWRSRLMVGRCRAALRREKQASIMSLAAVLLAFQGDNAAGASERLLALTEHENLEVRGAAVFAVSSIPSLSDRAVPILTARFDDAAWNNRISAMKCLMEMARREPGTMEPPARLLEIASTPAAWSIQATALRALGPMAASEAVLGVVRAELENADDSVAIGALEAYLELEEDEERLHEALLRMTRRPQGVTQMEAASMIAEHGPYTDEGITALIRVAGTPPLTPNWYTADVYQRLVEGPAPLAWKLEALERSLRDGAVRGRALAAIVKLGEGARPLVPVLRRAAAEMEGVEGTDPREVWLVRGAIDRLDPEGEEEDEAEPGG